MSASEKNLIPASNQQNAIMKPDPAAVAAGEREKSRIQAAYFMAFQNPRNVEESRIRILQACKRPVFAEKAEYKKPVGGATIKGPSIRLAELALREWGNVTTETQTVYEDDNVRRVKVFCTDLETNAMFAKEITLSKTVERKNATGREVVGERINSQGEVVFIVRATDDELNTKEAALVSKVVRNEGLRLIPTDIIEEALEMARKTVHDKTKEDPAAAKHKVLDAFASIGIMPSDLEQYLGHTTDNIQPAELDNLRTIYIAIKDGEAKWADYLEKPVTDDNPAGTNAAAKTMAKAEALKNGLKQQTK
jgi:hypothetical protein